MGKEATLAHRQGLTLAGYKYVKAGGERALAERRRGSLQKQAVREIKRSYAPAEEDLSRREKQIRSIDSKRASDEEGYKSWLTQQQANLRSEAEGRDQALRTIQGTQTKELGERLDAIRAASGGANIPKEVAIAQQGVLDRNAQSVTAVQGIQNLGVQQARATDSNAFAYQASLSAKRAADSYDKLLEVADDRGKVLLQKASDLNRRIAGLFDTEIKKAEDRIAQQLNTGKAIETGRHNRAGEENTRQGHLGTEGRWAMGGDHYGYTNDEWSKFSAAKRRSIRAKDKANKDKPVSGRQVAQWQQAVGEADGAIDTSQRASRTPGAKAVDRKLGDTINAAINANKKKKGSGVSFAKSAVDQLVAGGMNRDAANIAVFRKLYPSGKLPKWLREAKSRGIRAQSTR